MMGFFCSGASGCVNLSHGHIPNKAAVAVTGAGQIFNTRVTEEFQSACATTLLKAVRPGFAPVSRRNFYLKKVLGFGRLRSLENQVATHPVRSHALLARLRRFIEGLGPYQSMLILAIPTSLVEPLKLIALVIAGEGHWITGTAMIVAAYAVSLLLVERLFSITRPKLLTLPWFARLWSCFVVFRVRILGFFRSA